MDRLGGAERARHVEAPRGARVGARGRGVAGRLDTFLRRSAAGRRDADAYGAVSRRRQHALAAPGGDGPAARSAATGLRTATARGISGESTTTLMKPLITLLVALLSLLAPALARAGEGDAPVAARSAALKTQADALFDQSRFADAHALYSEAYAISHDPALLYNQGRSLEAMGDYPEAIAKLETFAAAAPPDMLARVPSLKPLLAGIRARVTTLVIRCNVSGAQVLVRGRVTGVVQGTLTTPVRAGTARVEVTAEGYEPFSREVDLPGNSSRTLDVALHEKTGTAVLTVRAEPSGSVVFIGGTPYGPAPASAPLQPGLYSLRIERPGYVDESFPVALKPGEKRDVFVALHESPPITTRWWFWSGIGAVVLGGAALTVALLTEGPAGSGSFSPGQIRSR